MTNAMKSDQTDPVYSAIHKWMSCLDDRERDIFLVRIATNAPRAKFTALARKYRVTRERIRQVNAGLEREVEAFLESPEGQAVSRRIHEAQERIGAAAPAHAVEALLQSDGPEPNHHGFILRFAGPYSVDKGWFIRCDHVESDPTNKILKASNKFGQIDTMEAFRDLAEWGLRPDLYQPWLLRQPHVQEFEGDLVYWRSIEKKAAFALRLLTQPSTPEEIRDCIGEPITVSSWTNALRSNPDTVRTSTQKWGLSSWGLPVYNSTPRALKLLIEEAGGEINKSVLVRQMNDVFDVTENTARTYMNVPAFVSDGEIVKIRDLESEP